VYGREVIEVRRMRGGWSEVVGGGKKWVAAGGVWLVERESWLVEPPAGKQRSLHRG